MPLAILDFGAQYTKVIDRRVRELHVESDILPSDTDISDLEKYDAFILSGGPHSVFEKNAPEYDPRLFTLGKPILGICYGMQLMNHELGGIVQPSDRKEYGETTIKIKQSPLFSGLSRKQQVLMSHGDSLKDVAPGFRVIATSKNIVSGIEDPVRQLYAVQFHPEVDLTTNGKKVLSNFLFRICGFGRDFTLSNRVDETIAAIRKQVGKRKVLVLVSGGVDSAVTAVLLLKALKHDQVYAIHVDHGLMRKGESKVVCEALKSLGLQHLSLVHAQKEFLHAKKGKDLLSTTTDPETKRKIIGDMFIKVVDREMKRLKLPKNTFLAQGTLRPDLIESASTLVSAKANKIKTHHNDSALVRKKRKEGLVIETNKDWHKDEVRQVGRMLGLPDDVVNRQPFPGPGLAVRILCSNGKKHDVESIQRKVKEIAARSGLRASVLPVRSVGVQGDHRSYGYVAVLSGIGKWSVLKSVAQEIPRVVHEINRVVYLFEQHVNGIKVTPTHLEQQVITRLQEADAVVRQKILDYNLSLSQVPVVLLPISFGKGEHAIVLRPFVTNDFMTGRAANFGKEMPIACLKEIVRDVSAIPGISAVLYDLTSKPPATTEWE